MRHKIYLLLLAVWFTSQGLFAQHQKHTHSNGVKCGSDHINEQFLLNNPEIAQKRRAFDKQISNLKKAGMIQSVLNVNENTILEIPIVIHIMHLGETPGTGYNPSDQQIINWVNFTNETLAGTANGIVGEGNGGTNIPIRLVLAKRTPECTSTNGIVRVNASGVPGYSQHGVHYATTTGTGSATTGASHQDIRNLSRWDPESYFNIYVVNNISDDVYGFAYLPGTSIDIDGSFMRTTLVGTHNTTFAHEMGHAFGLYHTFQGASSSLDGCPPTETDCTLQGDGVCDTEIIKNLGSVSYYDYPDNNTINPCTGVNYQGTQYNIMGYGANRNKFSPGQRERALLQVLKYRGNLLNSLALQDPEANAPTISLVDTCVPGASQFVNYGRGPVKVSFGDILVYSEGNTNTTPSYKNYVNSCLVNGHTTIPGYDPTPLSVTITYSQKVRAYIDWNNNGIFEEATETVIGSAHGDNSLADSTLIVSVTPPPFAVKGVPLRMRVIADVQNVNITPCYTPMYGQVEDYAITVIETINGCDGISDEIIAQISQEIVYVGDELYLQANGVLGSDGVQYQWQKSSDGSTGWTNVENTNAILGIVIAEGAIGSKTFYRLKVTCLISEEEHFSNVVSYEIIPQYCAAGATSTSGYKINNVAFAEINNNSTSTSGYEDFTHIITDLQVGNMYNFSASYPGTTSGWDELFVWIDFNYDGDFDDEGELVLQKPGRSPWTGNITIPANVSLGQRRMRIRLHNNDSIYTPNNTPCGNSSRGQVEDYTVNIIDVGCSGISDNITASIITGHGIENSALKIIAEGVEGVQGVNYQWQKAINDTDDWQDILNADSKILTTTIDTVAGNIVYYRLKVVCTDTQTTYYSNEINLPIYCVPTTTSFYESITAINVSDINYATTTNAKYYFPSASIAGNLTAGETYAFTATGNNNYAQDQIKVWIDFNSNGSFEDAGELVLTTSGLIPWNGNITIPGDVESGVTRMRVRLSYGAISTSCQNNDYGQTIDLMVNIHAVEGCTGISENIVAQTLDANSSTIGLKAEGVAGTTQTISYQWQQSFEESNEWLDIENANSLHSTVAIVGSIGQTINYRLKVTCLISDEEHFSNVVPYEIIPYYCAAGATSNSGHKINNVTFADINNDSTSTAGYEDFTHVVTDVQLGNMYDFSASYSTTTSNWDKVYVWIDFNYDGDFDDEGELVLQTSGLSPWTGNITIPENVSLGQRRMRIRMQYQLNSNYIGNQTPCGYSTAGQVEDYTVNIIDIGCSGISNNITASLISGNGNQGSTISITAQGVEGVQGVNYQWQKAVNNTNDWQDIINANSKILTTTIDTPAGTVLYYRLKVVCTETQVEYYSNEITLPIYCVPTITDYRHESITNINISDITYATTAIPTYYFSSSIAGNLTVGETYAFNATGNQNYPQDEIRVWVDFNKNGSFEDNGELLLIKAGATPWDGNISIPGDVDSGVTRMRVRLRYVNSSDVVTSCGDNSWGQTIDLVVNIHGIEGCSGISDNIVAYVSNSTSNNITLGATGVVGTAQNLSYQWQQNITGTEWEDIENATTAISTVTIWADSGQTINYRLKVTCNENQAISYSEPISHLFVLNYCSAGATNNTAYDVISNVNFAGIINNSTSTQGYEDFSSIVGTVTQGETYPFFAKYNGDSPSMSQILVWIDFNNNGVFTDPGERVLEISGASPWNGNITIPDGVIPGNRRMRIRLHYAQTGYNPNYTACGNTLYGQVEDYTINILPNLSNNCNITTTWNGTTWSNGIPDITKKAIIDGVLVMNTDLSACELEVTENGKITIPADRTLTVKGQVINHATSTDFVVANDAMLIQIDDVENQGAITVLRNSNPMKRLDYTLWSSPVEGMLLKNFSQVSPAGGTGTIWNRVYTLGELAWEQVWNSYAEAESGSHTFGIGKGYLYRARNDYHSTNTVVFQGEFTGIPNNGNITISTPLSFNGIGNPYPSAIDADEFMDANSGVNALYFWTNVNAPVDGSYTLNNWAYYTLLGGTGVRINGQGTEFYRPKGIILPGQGFVMETSGAQVSFNNSMRTSENEGFFRQMNTERHRFWLNLADDMVTYNQILVGYVENATQGVDTGIDAQMFGYEGNAIYSLIENSDKQFVIQARQLPFTDADVVPIGFRAVNAGSFTIALDNFDGLFAEGYTTIYLKDNFNGNSHNLNSGTYSFLSETGVFDNRFEIVYQTTMNVENPELNDADWIVYKQDKHFQVQTKGFELKEVWVYDLLGRILYKADAESTTHLIPALDVDGVFIVKVVTAQDKVLNKKVK